MISETAPAGTFDELRPRLMALLEMHRAAKTDDARARLAETVEQVFLAAAWHVANDLLENGWRPQARSGPFALVAGLRLVGGVDVDDLASGAGR